MSSPLSILDYRQPVEFSMGDVIVRTWQVLSRHLLTFLTLVGICHLLPLVLSFYVSRMAADRVTPGATLTAGALTLAVGVFNFILNSFAQAIVVFATFQDLRGRPVSGAESFRQGVARLFPVLISSTLVGLAMGIGFVLCLAPGLIAMAAFAVVLPACVVERLGPIESMSRSSDLTAGRWWPIVGVGFAWLVVVFVVTVVIKAAIPGVATIPEQLATWVWQVIAGSVSAVYAAILYHDLRAVREGIGINEIASAFD